MKKIFSVLLILLLIPVIAFAVSQTIGWDAPTTHTDGTPLNPATDLSGYQIGWGTAARGTSPSYPNLISVPNPGTLTATYTINSLPTGTLYFGVRAIDNAAQYSDWGNEIVKFFTPAPPSPPRNISFVTGLEVF